MVKAGDGNLQLLIQNAAVGHNHNAVIDCLVVVIVQACHTVGCPCDRV